MSVRIQEGAKLLSSVKGAKITRGENNPAYSCLIYFRFRFVGTIIPILIMEPQEEFILRNILTILFFQIYKPTSSGITHTWKHSDVQYSVDSIISPKLCSITSFPSLKNFEKDSITLGIYKLLLKLAMYLRSFLFKHPTHSQYIFNIFFKFLIIRA